MARQYIDAGDASRIDAANAKVEDEALVYSSDDRLEATFISVCRRYPSSARGRPLQALRSLECTPVRLSVIPRGGE
jgi:hypothetical protein